MTRRRLAGVVAAASVLLGSALTGASATTASATTASTTTAQSTPTSPTVTLTPVTDNTTCRYYNSATPPASNWAAVGFSDPTWPLGKMSFGHQESTRTDVGLPQQTVYFRCSFFFDATKHTADQVSVSARVDDGAVLYLNGQEFARTNMPQGPINHQTSASSVDSWDGQRVQTWTVDRGQIRSGWNHYAAEVHQSGNATWRSSDLTFDSTVKITATPVATVTQPTWKLAFADEFNGTSVDRNAWRVYHNTYGDGDPHMLHCLTPDNVAVSSGSLKLTARKSAVTCPNGKVRDYSSGFLGSRDVGRYYPLFGRYEVRARSPHGQGLFPAFWLRHRNGASAAEVDIFEAFHSSSPGHATQTLHFPTSLGYNIAKKSTKVEQAVQGRGGWHTYRVDILPVTPGDTSRVKFVFAVDGVETLSYTNNNTSKWTSTDPNATWDIALQLYVGGQWAGHPDQKLGWYAANGGICAQTFRAPAGGNPANCPTNGIWLAPWKDSTFEIDYVRVYTPA